MLSVCLILPRTALGANTPPSAVANLSLWYDANDSSTLTMSPATSVLAMADKSGNGATLRQPSIAAEPVYQTNSINGLSALVFNGTSDYLYSLTGFPVASDFTIVYLGTMTGSGWNNLLSDYSTNGTGSHAFYGAGSNKPTLWNQSNFAMSPTAVTTPFFAVATYTSSNRAGAVYTNGATTAGTGTAANPETDPSIELGGFSGAASYQTGMMGEALVFSRALSTTDRQTVEGYLACKWGLQANLPNTHPYASTCLSGFVPTSLPGLVDWYDASDASSLTLDASVTLWNDKSGNGANLAAPAASASRPALIASGINGLPAMAFSGGQYLYGTTGFPVSSDYSIATVSLFSGSTTNNIFSGYTASGTSHALYGNSGSTATMFQNGNIVAGPSTGTAAFIGIGTSQTSTGSVSVYVNGGSAATGVTGNKNVTDPSIETGGYSGAANYLTGDIGEVLVYHSVLSTAERQWVEGYLACKWGLQTSLPATHPYRSACPATATANLGLALSVSPAAGIASPGTVLTYTNTFTNASGTLVYNPRIDAVIPPNTYFQVGSATTSVAATGLTPTITFSKDGGVTYTYAPVSGGGGAAAGYDANVTNIRWTLSGALGPESTMNSGSVLYSVIVS
jgi:uncharacterized repeat protein (TIGR01451 family)